MDWQLILAIMMGLLIILFLTGLPIAFTFFALTIIGLFWFKGGEVALALLATSAHTSIGTFTLVALPLFILMGEALSHGGVVSILTEIVDVWIGRIRSRLCIVCLGAGTILAAMTGAAIGGAVVLGTTLFPEMDRQGYNMRLSIGTIMGSGILAAIIPPSMLAVLLGSLAKVSIAALFIGSILPGLLMVGLFLAYILILTRARPEMAPAYTGPKLSLPEKMKVSVRILPFVLIIFSVMGVIMLGIATPSEAAATGVVSCYVVIAIFKRMSWAVVKNSLLATMSTTAMIFLLFAGSISFSQVLAITGVTAGLTEYVVGLGLSPIVMFILMQLLIFVLCMFIDAISIMMITVPIFFPVVLGLGIEPVWFGVVYLINIVVGAMTPPFGLVLFATKGVIPKATVEDVFQASIPFVALTVLAMAMMIAFPQIVLWLPSVIRP